MPVTKYLERARQCAEIADRTQSEADKKKLLEIAEAWGDLAKQAAAEQTAPPKSSRAKDGGDAR